MTTHEFDWSELAFASKKPINELNATFIAAPREMSEKRFKQLVRQYLPKGNLLIGIAKESYVAGFEGQPHFRTLQSSSVRSMFNLVNKQTSIPHKMYLFNYSQPEFVYILQKCNFKQVVLVNGSWKHVFHSTKPYYALANSGTRYDMVSPFTDEEEARAYAKKRAPQVHRNAAAPPPGTKLSAAEMLAAAKAVARLSYDYCFQIGAAVGRPIKGSSTEYNLVAAAHNKVVPYETYALHHGSARERHFSPPQDLNHYDTIHAEVELILRAAEEGIKLFGTTLFINVLPCPTCARMFADTEIEEFVYQEDHSGGYAVAMLEAAGKKVRRIVLPEVL